VLLLAACSGMQASSRRHAGLDGYHTFAWIAPDPRVRARGDTPASAPVSRRIREAIEAQMMARGYNMRDPAGADIVLAFIVGTRDRIEAQAYPLEYRAAQAWQAYDECADLRLYREGTLTIEAFDRVTRRLVWRGSTTSEVSGADAARPGPLIDAAVAEILARLPWSTPQQSSGVAAACSTAPRQPKGQSMPEEKSDQVPGEHHGSGGAPAH
jgi:hypothetical protein